MQLGEMGVRTSQDIAVQTETLRDRERVRRAGKAQPETERGAQGRAVELHARVAHSRRVERERLELRVMRRRRDQDPARQEGLEDRHRERRALIGVGPGADLVEQRQVSWLGVGEGGDDVPQVRRERRQRLGDRLLVPDVREDAREHRRSTSRLRGDLQPRHSHERQKADRLQRDGLTAGVRAGHDEDAELAAQLHVDADDLPLVDEKRMPRVDKVDDPLVVECRA